MTQSLLIIDDNSDVSSYIKDVAESLHYSVSVTNDSTRFEQIYDAIEPETVVIDIFMPEKDGIEVLRQLVKRKSKARVLFISGSDDFFLSCAVRMAHDLGLNDVSMLRKPLKLYELRDYLTARPLGSAPPVRINRPSRAKA